MYNKGLNWQQASKKSNKKFWNNLWNFYKIGGGGGS